MECETHSKLNKEEFKSKILIGKKNTFDLVFLTLGVLSHIKYNDYWYCFCEDEKKCQTCVIPMVFSNFEKDIDSNLFDVNFLHDYYSKLDIHLNQMFDEKKGVVCCFLHQEFEHKGRDWTTGRTWSVSFTDSIRWSKKIKIDQMKAKGLPIPPQFTNKTVDLNLT